MTKRQKSTNDDYKTKPMPDYEVKKIKKMRKYRRTDVSIVVQIFCHVAQMSQSAPNFSNIINCLTALANSCNDSSNFSAIVGKRAHWFQRHQVFHGTKAHNPVCAHVCACALVKTKIFRSKLAAVNDGVFHFSKPVSHILERYGSI